DQMIQKYEKGVVFRFLFRHLTYFLLLSPFALAGFILHAPIFALSSVIARKISKDSGDMILTVKMVGAIVFLPLAWTLVFIVLIWNFGWEVGLAFAISLILSGYLALMYIERWENFWLHTKLFYFHTLKRTSMRRWLKEKDRIRQKLFDLRARIS